MKISVLFSANNLRLWLLVLFVGLLSLASYWVLEIVQSNNVTGGQEVRTRPDYWVENFNFVKMLPGDKMIIVSSAPNWSIIRMMIMLM